MGNFLSHQQSFKSLEGQLELKCFLSYKVSPDSITHPVKILQCPQCHLPLQRGHVSIFRGECSEVTARLGVHTGHRSAEMLRLGCLPHLSPSSSLTVSRGSTCFPRTEAESGSLSTHVLVHTANPPNRTHHFPPQAPPQPNIPLTPTDHLIKDADNFWGGDKIWHTGPMWQAPANWNMIQISETVKDTLGHGQEAFSLPQNKAEEA